MSVEQMRIEIMAPYGGKWKSRVLKMSDKQVIAVYYSFKKRGLI